MTDNNGCPSFIVKIRNTQEAKVDILPMLLFIQPPHGKVH